MKYLIQLILSLSASLSSVISHTSPPPLMDDITYTYLRCWYRTHPSHNDPSTAWVWARNDQGDYLKVEGYWRSEAGLKNMFYTQVPHNELLNHCLKTLNLLDNSKDILYFAADNHFSYNDTIWSNDLSPSLTINKIITFGDSLSDTGNIFNGSDWVFPNPHSWFLGHFSNGPVWTEYLAKNKQVPLYNWAIGGAAGDDKYIAIKGIHSQVKSFINYAKHAENYIPESTLFTFEFGLNDFINYHRDFDLVKADLDHALDELFAAGATNALVITLPDASRAPQFQYKSTDETDKVQKNIMRFNHELKKKIASLKAEGRTIVLFDAFTFFNEMLAKPTQFGFLNTNSPCLSIHRDTPIDYLSEHQLTPTCKQLGADKFIFWGVTHPTTEAHSKIAEAIESTVLSQFTFVKE